MTRDRAMCDGCNGPGAVQQGIYQLCHRCIRAIDDGTRTTYDTDNRPTYNKATLFLRCPYCAPVYDHQTLTWATTDCRVCVGAGCKQVTFTGEPERDDGENPHMQRLADIRTYYEDVSQ